MAKKEYNFEEVCCDIRQKKFLPVYFLMGEEAFFMDRITELIIENALEESERDFNQLILYGADTDIATIINAARRFPMMSNYQLVVVREAQLLRNIEELAFYVKKPLPSTILVVNHKYRTLDRRKSLASAVEKTGILFESKKVPDYKLPAFITSYLQEKGVGIEPKAAQMLADFLGNDLSKLTKELEKLILILTPSARRITPELVERNIGISKEYNNFELIKAIAVKDVLKANRIVQYFEKNPKSNPIQMTLPVIFNYFMNLLICSYTPDKTDNSLMQALGLRSAFQLKDYQLGIRNYPPMKVFNLIGVIRTCDAASKGVNNQSATDGELLKELVYRILH